MRNRARIANAIGTVNSSVQNIPYGRRKRARCNRDLIIFRNSAFSSETPCTSIRYYRRGERVSVETISMTHLVGIVGD